MWGSENRWVLLYNAKVQFKTAAAAAPSDPPGVLYLASTLSPDVSALPATKAGTTGDRHSKSGHWRILQVSCLKT